VTITRALMDAGELDEAMRMATSTLAITWNSEKAGVLELLAGVHSRRAEPAVAVQFMQRAHSIRVRCLGSKHHETAMSLSRTGSALLAAGSPAEVRSTCRSALLSLLPLSPLLSPLPGLQAPRDGHEPQPPIAAIRAHVCPVLCGAR
jgi:hypothetical protein